MASYPIEGLAPGRGAETFFLNSQGRIQVVARVYVAADHLLLECDAERRRTLLDYLDGYIIMDDVVVEDETDQTAAFLVEGPRSPDIATALAGAYPTEPHAHVEGDGTRLFRSTPSGGEGFWVCCPRDRASSMAARLTELGVEPATPDDFDAWRVARRKPLFDVDYFDRNIPQETARMSLVSFTKGCYVGQEIVERVRAQGQVRRLLRPLELDSNEIPAAREVLFRGAPVGELTSPTAIPDKGRVLGFALLKRAAAEPGTEIVVDGARGRVLGWE